MRPAYPRLTPLAIGLVITFGCRTEPDHEDEDGAGQHGHEHAHDDHEHDDHEQDDRYEHDDHGHGHQGASEVVTLWGDTTQLFVQFPALVVGEDSPFAAHLTRLLDHYDIDRGSLVVELSGGEYPVERFSVDHPSVPGIFRLVVRPAHPGPRRITLRLESPAASDVHVMGDFTVFATRAEADATTTAEAELAGSISYLLEQQWRVPFRVERVEARLMRPTIPAFARLALPNDAESSVTAPRDGRLVAAGGRFPLVGEEVEAGVVLAGLSTAPQEGTDPATLDLAVEQASIRVEATQREVDRMVPLVEQGVVARRRLDEARSALSEAEAALRGARRRRSSMGQSQRVEDQRDSLEVPSPIGGTIAEIFVAPGAWVREGQELVRIVDRDRLWLDVGVPEAYVGRLGTISGVWFRLDNVAGVLELTADALVSIGTEIDPDTRTLPVRFRIDNVRRELFAGMTTQAHLVVDEPQLTAAVPLAAVIDDAGADVVYVQTGGETFVRRPVRLGIRDGMHVEVLDGVAPGEWVVSRGGYSVKLASTSTQSIGHGHAH